MGDRMLFFAGLTKGALLNEPRNDLWALSLTGAPTWSLVSPAGAPPQRRHEHRAVYDPLGQRMIVVGGGTAVGAWDGGTDTWALSLSGPLTWSQLVGGGSEPLPRSDASAVFDRGRARVVVFGGYATGDLRGLEGGVEWYPLAGPGGWGSPPCPCSGPWPAARAAHSAIYDPVRDRMIVFGGAVDDGDEGSILANDLWAFSLSDTVDAPWSRLDPVGPEPSRRGWHRAIYDPEGDRMIIYGGVRGPTSGDLWSLSLSGAPVWTELHTPNEGPGSRVAHSLVYDLKHHRA